MKTRLALLIALVCVGVGAIGSAGTADVAKRPGGGVKLKRIGNFDQPVHIASAPGFPVLIGNAIDWLVRPEARGAQRAGLSSFNPATTQVTGPGGRQVPLVRTDAAVLARLRAPGLYVAEGAGASRTFAVNVSDPQVSNTARTTFTEAEQAGAAGAGASQRPWWMYCAAAAFVLALAEWWTWQRRVTV